jgi:hypothetical protein
MELWRRLILLVLICVAIWLAKLASLAPVMLIEPLDFAEKQKNEGSYLGVRIMTDEKQRLSDMSLNDYIAEITGGRLFQVKGKEWDDIFDNAIAVAEGKSVRKEWAMRLPSDQHPMKVLFFRADEPPVNTLSGHFKKANDRVYVFRTMGNGTKYLELDYRVYSDDDFHFGSGLSNYPHPPTYLLFPYRTFSLWLALAGLIIYLALPRKKAYPGDIRYPFWRIVLGDILSFIVIVPFFSFPILIIGGSKQLFTQGWPLIPFFWPFFFLGVRLLQISAWFASYRVLLLEDRIRISTYRGLSEFLFRDMSFYQPVIFKPPKWLIAFSWLAALSGKGSAQIGAAGRAMILSSSASESIGIRLKNGSDLFINITDQMGNDALKGFKEILMKLKSNGVQETDEVREIRSLGLETMKFPVKS